jgi:phospholipid transport system transporter-binding protein
MSAGARAATAHPMMRSGNGGAKANLEALGDHRFRLSGVLNAATAAGILQQGTERFAGAPEIDVDLGGVIESDSAGLALLIEWLRGARDRGQRLRYANLPAQISALARISEVEELLVPASAAAAPAAAPPR